MNINSYVLLADIVGVLPFCHSHEGNIRVKSWVVLKNKWISVKEVTVGNVISVPSTIVVVWYLSIVNDKVVPDILVVTKLSEEPVLPVSPVSPLSPLSPLGIPRLRVRLGVVPVMLAVALLPASNVVIVPIVILGVSPASPFTPWGPAGPVGPCSPWLPLALVLLYHPYRLYHL